MTNSALSNLAATIDIFHISPNLERSIGLLQDATQPLKELAERLEEGMRPFHSKLAKIQLSMKRTAPLLENAFNFELPKTEFKISEEACQEWDWMMARFRAALANPEAKNSKPWLAISHMGPCETREFIKYFPDPRAKRGAPKGGGRVATDEELFREVHQLVMTGLRPTTAARQVLQKRGYKAGIRNQAKYIAKLYKRMWMSGKK